MADQNTCQTCRRWQRDPYQGAAIGKCTALKKKGEYKRAGEGCMLWQGHKQEARP